MDIQTGSELIHTNRKTTVEECFCLSISQLIEKHLVTDLYCERFFAFLKPRHDGRQLILYYSCTAIDDDEKLITIRFDIGIEGVIQSVVQQILVTPTYPLFGGECLWIHCPIQNGNQKCGRRVVKLWIPPNGRYFGCRQCHDLSYQSCQKNHYPNRLDRMEITDRIRKENEKIKKSYLDVKCNIECKHYNNIMFT